MKCKKKVVKSLLCFLKQTADFETKSVIKNLLVHKQSQTVLSTASKPLLSSFVVTEKPQIQEKPPQLSPVLTLPVQLQTLKKEQDGIYHKLVEKIKKACPELRIKNPPGLKKANLPDCDVIFLSEVSIPQVYQGLIKAIDKQLALTEAVFLDPSMMEDFLIKNFKLILAPPFVKNLRYFMSHVKLSPDLKTHYLGSSELIFLEPPEQLEKQISKKQILWQWIKIRLS